jgi:hypothetical protein
LPDVPEVVEAEDVSYSAGEKRRMPRWLRRDNAVAMLSGIISACEQWLEDHAEDSEVDDVEQFKNEIEEAMSVAEGVEFPGMMG